MWRKDSEGGPQAVIARTLGSRRPTLVDPFNDAAAGGDGEDGEADVSSMMATKGNGPGPTPHSSTVQAAKCGDGYSGTTVAGK